MALCTAFLILQVVSTVYSRSVPPSDPNTNVTYNNKWFQNLIHKWETDDKNTKLDSLNGSSSTKRNNNVLYGILDNTGDYVFIQSQNKYMKINKQLTKKEVSLDESEDFVYVESSKLYFELDKDDNSTKTSNSIQKELVSEENDVDNSQCTNNYCVTVILMASSAYYYYYSTFQETDP